MPFVLNWEPNGVVIGFSGELQFDEVLACNFQVTEHPQFDELRFAVVDTLAVKAIDLTLAEVQHIESFLEGPKRTNPNVKVVFVVAHPEVHLVLSYCDAIARWAYHELVCDSTKAARDLIAQRASRFHPRGWPRR